MRERFIDYIHSLTWHEAGIGIAMFIVGILVSFGSIALVMVNIPAHYFSSHYADDFMAGSPWLVRWGATIMKNVLGILLVLVGIVLSLPGVPGQGILTILVGLILMDIPGKRPLEARIIKQPKVLAAINALRAKYDKPALVVD